MYKARLNNRIEKEVEQIDDEKFSVGGKEYTVEKFKGEKGLLIARNGEQSFKIKVHNFDLDSKILQLRINGVKHHVEIKDRFDILLEKLGFNSKGAASINQIKAPMPGLIIEVNVSEGDSVSKGDKVLVLEAMKMENVIKSPGDGVVKEIKIKEGDSVEKNQVLIQF